MALPKIQHTLYEHHLVGMNKTIKFRPFTNHEQKTLLLAKETGNEDKSVIINAINEIISGCTNGKVDGNALATFDVEDLFMRIRAKSVGEVVKLKYRYDYHDDEDKPKSDFVDVEINIDDIKVEVDPEHDNKIMITDKIGIVMKYPTFGLLGSLDNDDDIAIACIDYVFDETEVYPTTDSTKEELRQFYDDIDTRGLLAIKKFFETLPKLRHSVDIELADGKVETVTYEGLEDFFT